MIRRLTVRSVGNRAKDGRHFVIASAEMTREEALDAKELALKIGAEVPRDAFGFVNGADFAALDVVPGNIIISDVSVRMIEGTDDEGKPSVKATFRCLAVPEVYAGAPVLKAVRRDGEPPAAQ